MIDVAMRHPCPAEWSRAEQPQVMNEAAYQIYQSQLERHHAAVKAAHGQIQMDLARHAREVDELGRIGCTHRRTRQFKRGEADAAVRQENMRLLGRLMDISRQAEKR